MNLDQPTGKAALSFDLSLLKLSQQIWGKEWENVFPKYLENSKIHVSPCTYEEAMGFARNNFQRIFTGNRADSAFLYLESSDFKENYYRRTGDFLLLKNGNDQIGMFIGTPLDWSTYNIRSISILPEYQNRGIFQEFLQYFLEQVKLFPVHRLLSEVAPSNVRNVHVFSKFNFLIAGIILSERWGSLLQMTKYLSESHEAVFHQQFSQTVAKLTEKNGPLRNSN